MATGLYQDNEIVERFLNAVVAGTLGQRFVVPADYDVISLMANLGQAPGAGNTLTINVSNNPTSQSARVAPYNLWTAANVPTITGTAFNNFTTSVANTVIENIPYALNYPLPGPTGTTGYFTAQSTAIGTSNPVTAPPTLALYQVNPASIVVPDNTYTDYNGIVQPASLLHAGDVLTFSLGGTIGSSSDLEIVLYISRH